MLCDIIIIGGGPAGYLAAERAASNGFSVTVFDMDKLGGVCLNEGCIPTKALLHAAKTFESARASESFGVSVDNAAFSLPKAQERKKRTVKKLNLGIAASLKALKVNFVNEEIVSLTRNSDGAFIALTAGGFDCQAKYVIVATGGEVVIPPIPGVKESMDSGITVTSRGLLDLQSVPNTAIVIGAGVVGLELAEFMALAGTRVTVVELQNKIAGATDSEISATLQESLEKRGISFALSTAVKKINKNEVLICSEDGEERILSADVILLSVGRRAKSTAFLDSLGVNKARDAIVVNEKLETNVDNLFAIGDANGILQLAHTAYREAEVVINNLSGGDDKIDYDTIPSVIYTLPEVASVGLTEATAKERGYSVSVKKLSTAYSGRYVAEHALPDKNFVKLIIDTDSDTIIGAQAICGYSSEFITTVGAFITLKTKISDVKRVVFPHPSVSELIHEALYME